MFSTMLFISWSVSTISKGGEREKVDYIHSTFDPCCNWIFNHSCHFIVVIIIAHTFERHSFSTSNLISLCFFFLILLVCTFISFIHGRTLSDCGCFSRCCYHCMGFYAVCTVRYASFADRYRIICRFITVIILPLVCHYWLPFVAIAHCCYYYNILFLYFSDLNAIVWLVMKWEPEYEKANVPALKCCIIDVCLLCAPVDMCICVNGDAVCDVSVISCSYFDFIFVFVAFYLNLGLVFFR